MMIYFDRGTQFWEELTPRIRSRIKEPGNISFGYGPIVAEKDVLNHSLWLATLHGHKPERVARIQYQRWTR